MTKKQTGRIISACSMIVLLCIAIYNMLQTGGIPTALPRELAKEFFGGHYIISKATHILFCIGVVVSGCGCGFEKKHITTVGLFISLVSDMIYFIVGAKMFPPLGIIAPMLDIAVLTFLFWVMMILLVELRYRVFGCVAVVSAVVIMFCQNLLSYRFQIIIIGYILIAVCLTILLPKKEPKTKMTIESAESTTDKLVKLKSLLDSGAITQEEFDEKKKEFLNL